VIPFVTEELWAHVPGRDGLLAAAPYAEVETALVDVHAETAIARVIEAVTTVRSWRNDAAVRAGAVLPARLAAEGYEQTAPLSAPAWSERDAERYLLSLELFGMRFGLDRMRRLMTALGSPQERFGSVHVVGTNGKSSTTRMIAAILRRHGLRAGAYLSPHLVSFTERIRVDDSDVDGERFAAAVLQAARAAAKVDRTLDEGDRVTQFEA